MTYVYSSIDLDTLGLECWRCEGNSFCVVESASHYGAYVLMSGDQKLKKLIRLNDTDYHLIRYFSLESNAEMVKINGLTIVYDGGNN